MNKRQRKKKEKEARDKTREAKQRTTLNEDQMMSQNTNGGERKEPAKPHKEIRQYWRPKLDKPSDWALLILTAAIAVIYYGQLCEMRKTTELTHDSLVDVQRAFVSISKVETTPTREALTGKLFWEFVLKIDNNGTTPALQYISFFRVDKRHDIPEDADFWGKDVIDDQSKPENEFPQNTLPPRGQKSVGTVSKEDSEIFEEEPNKSKPVMLRRRLKTSDGSMFSWGWVAYYDVFDKTKPHITEFCRKLDNFGIDPERQQIVIRQRDCKKHNCQDDGCSDYEKLASLIAPLMKKQ